MLFYCDCCFLQMFTKKLRGSLGWHVNALQLYFFITKSMHLESFGYSRTSVMDLRGSKNPYRRLVKAHWKFLRSYNSALSWAPTVQLLWSEVRNDTAVLMTVIFQVCCSFLTNSTVNTHIRSLTCSGIDKNMQVYKDPMLDKWLCINRAQAVVQCSYVDDQDCRHCSTRYKNTLAFPS